MLKEFAEYLSGLQAAKLFTTPDGCTYSNQKLELVSVGASHPETKFVSSLSSLCDLVREEWTRYSSGKIFVHVESASRVSVFSEVCEDERFDRDAPYVALSDAPGFRNKWMKREEALISLRSLFIPTEDSEYLLDLLSRFSSEDAVTSLDNGVTQRVSATKGVSMKENIEIRPRVCLRPFRTFLEVEQVASEFIFRVDNEGNVGFFEADGGMWALEAKANIAGYLTGELNDLIEAGTVVVLQ